MKTYHPILVSFLFAFLSTGKSGAQLSSIDSLKIIPDIPTTADIVKVISYTTFSTGGCPLTNSSVSVIGTTINVYALHTLGMLTYICHSTDTLIISNLNSGRYKLIYHLTGAGPSTASDIDSIMFKVQQVTGLQPNYYSESEIKIYPNPATAEINIDLDAFPDNGITIDIYSLTGHKIRTVRTDKNRVQIDINDLAEGVYFIVITNGHESRRVKNIIINSP